MGVYIFPQSSSIIILWKYFHNNKTDMDMITCKCFYNYANTALSQFNDTIYRAEKSPLHEQPAFYSMIA